MKKLGLTGRIALWLVGGALVAIIIVGYLAYTQGNKALVNGQVQSMVLTADAKELNIKQEAQLRFEMAKLIASTIEDLSSNGINSPEVIQDVQEKIEHAMREMSVVSEKNQYEDINNPSDLLYIEVWDANGVIVADTQQELIGQTAPEVQFNEVKKSGTYFGGFEVNALSGKQQLVFLQEVRSEADDRFAGVVAMKVSTDMLNAITNNPDSPVGESGEAYIVNSDYLMITKSRFNQDSVLTQKVDTEATRACFERREETAGLYDDYAGHVAVGASMYLNDFGWCLVVELDEDEIVASSLALRNQIVAVGFAIVLVLLVTSVFVARSVGGYIRRPIRAAAEQMGAASSRLSSSTQQSAAASQQNSSIAQQVASGAKEQSEKAEEITKSITEMSSAIQQMASSSKDASSAASETSKLAQDTGEKGMKSRQSLEEIKDMVQGTANMIRGMSEKSKSIGDIVETITSIAEQTNLLALNAAIEAARAGDAGRGFAVVADEVRKLAEGSAKAAEEVKSRIKDMLDQINDNVATVETGVKHAGESSEIINETLSNLQNMAAAIQQVTAKIQEVTAGVDQQSAAVQQVARAMDSIAAISEQNASGAEQLSASAQQQSSANQQVAAAAQQLQMLAGDLGSLAGDMKQYSATLAAAQRPAIATHAAAAPKASPVSSVAAATDSEAATAHKITNG